jgi:Cys-Gly metallodipeptidase DUG1
MGDYLQQQLKQLGASVETRDPGTQDWNGTGRILQLPPVVLATLGSDPNKKTVLVYGHYDVQPVIRLILYVSDGVLTFLFCVRH